MHEMRRGVVPLDIAAPCFIDLGHRSRRLKRLTKCPDDRALAVHLLDTFDRQLPPVALHDAGVTDLATRLSVERVLLENQLELVPSLPECDGLSLRLCGLVPDPLLLALLL